MTTNPIHSETATLLDQHIHKILKQGGTKVIVGRDQEGNPIVEMIDISASMIRAISARLKDLGIQSPAMPGTAAGNLMEAAMLRFQGKKIPAVSTESDDASEAV